MPRYSVKWIEKILVTSEIEADTEKEAIAKIKGGDAGDDLDTEPVKSTRTNIEASEL
jgi:hypothetical protein